MNYQEAVDYLYTALPVFQHNGGAAYKPGLQTIGELVGFYGNPQQQFKSIHVAGTNGKGSVAHIIAAVLQGCGYTTGLFTSPHLIDFRERIRINGTMISEEEVRCFVERSVEKFKQVEPSFFEVTTAMAFDHFARHNVDVAVIETGMGGRLDATNIIMPAMSVITNIGLDHTQFLGNNLLAIAAEKAGIIKPGTPVVVGVTQAGVAQVFQQRADELHCPIVFADQKAQVSRVRTIDGKQEFYISQQGQERPTPVVVDLLGEYQRQNIITALMAIQMIIVSRIFELPAQKILPAIADAARTTGLRGRWQVLRENPTVVCDGGHNVDGLSRVTHQLRASRYKRLLMVVGFVNDKDIKGMLALLPVDALYYFTQANINRALSASALEEQAKPFGLTGKAFTSVSEAVRTAINEAEEQDMIFIGGSIFVVGEALNVFSNMSVNSEKKS